MIQPDRSRRDRAYDATAHGNCKKHYPIRGGAMLLQQKRQRENAQMSSAFSEQANATKLAEFYARWRGKSSSRGTQVSVFKCRHPLYAPLGDCPLDCPHFAALARRQCHFKCVAADECGSGALGLVPGEHIADPMRSTCRACNVVGCRLCSDERADKCATCSGGYTMSADGKCVNDFWVVWLGVFSFAGALVVPLLCWYLSLWMRPVVNKDGVHEGLAYRSRVKLRMPPGYQHPVGRTSVGNSQLWPLDTNLHREMIAGPGLIFHFDFQATMIIWACVCVAFWIIFAYSTEPELLLVGLFSADSPHELCAVTFHGKDAQTRIMWAKLIYLVIVYLFTFAGAIGYAVYHRHMYDSLDLDNCTLRDFAAVCSGLPRTAGTERLEEELTSHLRTATGQDVVGVSVCWDYMPQASAVNERLEKDALPLEPDENRAGALLAWEAPKILGLFALIDKIFGFRSREEISNVDADATDAVSAKALVESLASTETAFIVFSTEADRDAAVEKFSTEGGLQFKGSSLTLEPVDHEPATVCWEIYSVSEDRIWGRMLIGVSAVLVAVIIWCVCFFGPYAYYISSFSAVNNERPVLVERFVFTMIVVGGNQGMYFICNQIAHKIGFRQKDKAEAYYVVIYTCACLCNFVGDLALEFWVTYNAMVAAGVRTADGNLIEDLTSYQDIFESYPMQKALGLRLVSYCFPSSFLVPFLMEPIFAIYVPYHLMTMLLRSYRGVRGLEAEKSLDFFAPMDMGRYGDISLNVTLMSLIFFFPPGQMLKLFLAFIISHLYIYYYDRYRVLRAVPGFAVDGIVADERSQDVLMLPCSFLAAVIVFKGNSLAFLSERLHGYIFGAAVIGAFFAHMALHSVMLRHVVPKLMGSVVSKPVLDRMHAPEETYATVAAYTASTWFSSNPVHCLRSKYIYGHSPPCGHYVRGREYRLRANPEIGCYFEDRVRQDLQENYSEALLSPRLSWQGFHAPDLVG